MNPADVASATVFGGGGYPQVAYFYDANENLEYVCIGDWGALTSEAKWKIFKLAYDANNKWFLLHSSTRKIWFCG